MVINSEPIQLVTLNSAKHHK